MRLFTIATFLTSLFCFQICVCDQTSAQEIRKTRADFGGKEGVMYQPCDPWTRSKAFNIQTGNSGRFYNCDGEQCKRNSPYICWKPDDKKNFPPYLGIWRSIKQDVAQVRQRVQDGSCGEAGNGCRACEKARSTGQSAYCASCAQAAERFATEQQVASINRSPTEQRLAVETAKTVVASVQTAMPAEAPKFGLLQGKIIEARSTTQVEPAQPSQQRAVANKSLLDHVRGFTRR